VLDVDSVTVHRGERRVLDRASFRVRRGQIVAVVGPNGAGKTTLLEAVLGLRSGTGRVIFDGETLDVFRARAAVFAYMPDESALPEEASVDTILRASHREPTRREREARRFGITAFLDRGARELSRGEAKRVWLAATVLLERPVLVLDEPFGAFDPLQLDEVLPAVKDAIGSDGIALVTVHQMTIAERIADHIVILAEGRVVAEGTIAELRADSAVPADASLEDVFRALLRKKAGHVAT
jgi:ABC-type multidrug transport system ATPase subunit